MVNKVVRTSKCLLFLAVASSVFSNAFGWMEKWAPYFKCEPSEMKKLSPHSISNFVNSTLDEESIGCSIEPEYSQGASIDLNADGFADFVFIVPWIATGLNASGCTAYFIVSDGKGGRNENILEGYGLNLGDLVKINGKIYMRHSTFFEYFQNSRHNHWVYQIFSFGSDGVMKCANHEVGDVFPAATIFYENPKFKRVALTKDDFEGIAKSTKPLVQKYKPW